MAVTPERSELRTACTWKIRNNHKQNKNTHPKYRSLQQLSSNHKVKLLAKWIKMSICFKQDSQLQIINHSNSMRDITQTDHCNDFNMQHDCFVHPCFSENKCQWSCLSLIPQYAAVTWWTRVSSTTLASTSAPRTTSGSTGPSVTAVTSISLERWSLPWGGRTTLTVLSAASAGRGRPPHCWRANLSETWTIQSLQAQKSNWS